MRARTIRIRIVQVQFQVNCRCPKNHYLTESVMALKHSSLAFVSAVRRQWGMLVLASAGTLAAIGPVVLKAQDQRGFAQTAVSESVAVNGNYYALVIGIDKYPAPLHQLKTPVNDAQSVG